MLSKNVWQLETSRKLLESMISSLDNCESEAKLFKMQERGAIPEKIECLSRKNGSDPELEEFIVELTMNQ